MAHELEMINGQAAMAYVGDLPWHGLGVKLPEDCTPAEMLRAAQLDWTVEKIPAFIEMNGQKVMIDKQALIRSTDNRILSIVSDDWNEVQNAEAFAFFQEYCDAGSMKMHTAGSLKGGEIVWALAKVGESFELFGGDRVDSYMLFTNFHRYGWSTDVRFTPVRVVCNNTLSLSLGQKVERSVKFSHRKAWNPEVVKEMLGIASTKMMTYKEMAEHLGSARYTIDTATEYFKAVFPVATSNENSKKELSKNARLALNVLDNQPGTNFAEGTWWQAANAVTYIVDHLAGRNDENRLNSAWYGGGKDLKFRAMELATEFANAA